MGLDDRQDRSILFGGLIILGLLVLAVGLFALDAVVAKFRNPDRIYAVLPQAPKLAAGARVWISGKDVGEVTEVALMPFTGDTLARIAATIEFPHEYHEQLRRDSRVRITSARMIGSPVIDIAPGSLSAPELQHGDTLYMGDLITIAELRDRALVAKASFDSALVELRAVAGPAGRRMKSLQPVMRNMAGAQRELAALMADFRNGPAARVLSDGELTGAISSLQETVSRLGPAFAQARARLNGPGGTGGAAGVATSLKRMQGNAERLSAALSDLQAMMVEQNGTLYRMSADSALLKTLHTAQAQLDSLIAESKANPMRFIF
ncbi:MAG TPA: MlaD family protein [Longimicrobiales bacterium]